MSAIPPFIDAHLHVWDADRLVYPWLADPAVRDALGARYLPLDLARDAAGLPLEATVHVQAEMDHAVDPAIETKWLAELRGDSGFPDVCVGYADLTASDLGMVLDRHQDHPFFRGIRQEAWFDPHSIRADIPRHNMLDDPRWETGLKELARRSLSFDLLIFAHQLAQAKSIFTRHADLRVVLDHCAMPPLDDSVALGNWDRDLRTFAKEVPRSCIKISGLAMLAPDRPFAGMADIVARCLDAFGPARCMLASNFPVDRPGRSYRDLWSTYAELAASLGTDERDRLFSGTAGEFYGIYVG